MAHACRGVAPAPRLRAGGGRLRRYLARLAARDTALDHDMPFRNLLQEAGHDPVMGEVQDRFIDRVWWSPGVRAAEACGIGRALGTAVGFGSDIRDVWRLVWERTEERHG